MARDDPAQVNIYYAFKIWRQFHNIINEDIMWINETKESFADFLGGFEGTMGVLSTWKLSPEGENKLRILVGPHAETLLKIYYAQHPELIKPALL